MERNRRARRAARRAASMALASANRRERLAIETAHLAVARASAAEANAARLDAREPRSLLPNAWTLQTSATGVACDAPDDGSNAAPLRTDALFWDARLASDGRLATADGYIGTRGRARGIVFRIETAPLDGSAPSLRAENPSERVRRDGRGLALADLEALDWECRNPRKLEIWADTTPPRSMMRDSIIEGGDRRYADGTILKLDASKERAARAWASDKVQGLPRRYR